MLGLSFFSSIVLALCRTWALFYLVQKLHSITMRQATSNDGSESCCVMCGILAANPP